MSTYYDTTVEEEETPEEYEAEHTIEQIETNEWLDAHFHIEVE